MEIQETLGKMENGGSSHPNSLFVRCCRKKFLCIMSFLLTFTLFLEVCKEMFAATNNLNGLHEIFFKTLHLLLNTTDDIHSANLQMNATDH